MKILFGLWLIVTGTFWITGLLFMLLFESIETWREKLGFFWKYLIWGAISAVVSFGLILLVIKILEL